MTNANAPRGFEAFAKPGELDFVAAARVVRCFWEEHDIFRRRVEKNRGGPRFSFIDGPITANNPMGVHHAWGRTFKDLVQRFKGMCGYDQRYQNGFDCQGLWVEVEVEKALGFNSKRDIEAFGLDKFSHACRDRVLHFSKLQTEQSKALGQWMDWPNSYYTMSDRNIEYIWHFLERCHALGWLYVGHRVMPWCIRCGTSISQHEMLDSYTEIAHDAVVVALPLVDQPAAHLLVWTTTPWTLPANVAVAVRPDLDYAECELGGRRYYVAAMAVSTLPALSRVVRTVKGSELLGARYRGPFDDLPAQQGVEHRVIAWDEVSAEEGTGLVHIAPGCGQEDFELGRQHGLPVIAPIDEDGCYLDGFGALTGQNALDATPDIVRMLRDGGSLFSRATYRHRYPTCWRCGHELVFRLVDEWFIRADELRPRARALNAGVEWIPEYVGLRMDDWLANMSDWCISRKRFWGLPLPFYPCSACGRLTVIRSRAELLERALDRPAVEALPELHRPWIDTVVIACPDCHRPVRRVPEVGDCWLDAGVVPFSTLGYLEDRASWRQWFPADFVTESVGQLRGWFYALLFMATTLEDAAPYRTVLGHERVLGADGREMHKSWGNAIWFDDAVNEMGPDVIRYMFAAQAITEPIRFGYQAAREVKRRFLTLWNVYRLFVTYANLDRPPLLTFDATPGRPSGLETWLLSRLQATIAEVRTSLDTCQIRRAVTALDSFIRDDLSNWYVRRRRREFWKGEFDARKLESYQTLYHVLVRVCQLLAPIMPFLADAMYRNLTVNDTAAPLSVHLTSFPVPDPALANAEIESGVVAARRVLSAGLAARNAHKIKARQPLGRALVVAPAAARPWMTEFETDIRDELNVEQLEFVESLDEHVAVEATLDVRDPSAVPLGSLPLLREALSRRPGPAVREDLVTTGHLTVPLPGGDTVTLGWADVRITVRGRAPYAAAGDRDILVALDTTMTDDLRRKGVARHLVHQIQVMRKDVKLNVEDRIKLVFTAPAELKPIIEEHRQYIGGETLAEEVAFGAAPAGWTSWPVTVDNTALTISLAPAASPDS